MKSRAGPVRWLREHPFAADVLLALLVTAITLPGPWITREGYTFREPDGLGLFLTLLATVPLAWRRRYPFTVFNVVLVASVISGVMNYGSSSGGLSVIVTLYTMAAYCDRRRSLAAAALSAVGVSLVLAAAPVKVEPADIFASYVVFAAAWILGDNVRVRRAYVAELEDRTDRLERERAAQARRAVATERGRIARELHDVIAHHVSVMVVQAGGARRVLDRQPDQAKEALQSIEATGRQALGEMRRLLGVLRSDDDALGNGERQPQPGVGALDLLVDQLREAGLPVDLRVEGTPRPLESGVDLSAYRIVQEALTNTLKHAGPAEAHVVVRYDAEDVVLEITDDGRGGAADAAVAGANGGHGLVGMKERVSLFGGELQAGPKHGGGYRVRARLPTRQP